MKQFFFALLTVFIFAFSANAQTQDGRVQSPDVFPEGSYWVNSEFPVHLENLKEKVVVIIVSDERCIECGYFISQIQNSLITTSAVQILQVMPAQADLPVSRNHLLQFIQKNGYTHPIGILPDLSGFHNATIEQAPYFLMYEKSQIPSLTGQGQDGFAAVMKRLDALKEEKNFLASCMMHQLRTVIEPGWWANPVVETPTYIAEEEGGDGIFINDAAHNRILAFNEDGTVRQIVGTTLPGYVDEGLYTSAFRRPHGIVHSDNKLFVADTYNNRVRVVDYTTEKVTSLLGSGYITWKKAKTIDARFEEIGLPVDLAVIGMNLYVLSATTNQVFEVNMRDGSAKEFCQLPEGRVGILRNCPVNVNAAGTDLYVTMANGDAYVIDKKGRAEPLFKKDPIPVASVCAWKEGIAGCGKDGKVYYFDAKSEKWNVVGEPEKGSDKKNMVILNHPHDMMNRQGDLFISDTENHMIRELGSPGDKLMKNFWFKLSQELIGFEAAHTGGDVVLMDTIFLNKKTVKMNVLLDLEGYVLAKEGQNEVLMNDITGNAQLLTDVLRKEEFLLQVKPEFPDGDLYVEVYMTLEHPEKPGLFLIKRAYLDFPVVQDKDAEDLQEQIYKPNLLPY